MIRVIEVIFFKHKLLEFKVRVTDKLTIIYVSPLISIAIIARNKKEDSVIPSF